MNYNYGNECAKAVQEFRDLTKDFENERQWIIKYSDLYKKIYIKDDRIETDFTITRDDMLKTYKFHVLYKNYNFDDDSNDNLYDADLV
jgi:hypothetical protein